ncbi:hypothetical protein ABZ705_12800 [Streptomyces sp. NPDC006984]|uniref:hypothetical protein n=1 Tax=Streptomyces sp. NPDC006984 TaxID=3155463 RepID=UPI00340CF71B
MADQQVGLTQVLERIDALLQASNRRRDQVLDIEQLARDAALPAETVHTLLDGGQVPQMEFSALVRQRFAQLRASRLRQKGEQREPYSLREIGESFGLTGAALSAWGNAERNVRPSVEAVAGIERFYGVPRGFLYARPDEALADALRPVLEALEDSADPYAVLAARHPGVKGLTLRRFLTLPEQEAQVVQQTVEALDRLLHEDRADDAGP